MSQYAIHVDGLGKCYPLVAAHPSRSLRQTLTGALHLPLRYRRWAAEHARSTIWALKDVSFAIEHGEVVGIIGPNGAGKSTLLKILSRVTKPTTGQARIRGRVGSLLEVGTGFHPELSGRENIYLNGAVLGMRRDEIRRKFDEIVAFSEVEEFLDTPIKHYSSGMYVRLAFAVAAHLEPTILIVDEVLAVGDVAFQQKCLGKMDDAARGGRTVLFVSHNMDVIQQLCPRSLLFEHGQLVAQGHTPTIIDRYLAAYAHQTQPNRPVDLSYANRSGSGAAHFTSVQYSSGSQENSFRPYTNGPLEFTLTLDSDAARAVGSLAVFLSSRRGTKLVNANTVSLGRVLHLHKGSNRIKLRIEALHLMPGVYRVGLWLADPIRSGTNSAYDYVESAFDLEVVRPASGPFLPDPNGLVPCFFDVVETG